MSTKSRGRAWVTLLTKPSYLPGVLVVEHSLRVVHSKYPLVVMVTSGLPSKARDVLIARGIETIPVEGLDVRSRSTAFKDERFKDTWTKLR